MSFKLSAEEVSFKLSALLLKLRRVSCAQEAGRYLSASLCSNNMTVPRPSYCWPALSLSCTSSSQQRHSQVTYRVRARLLQSCLASPVPAPTSFDALLSFHSSCSRLEDPHSTARASCKQSSTPSLLNSIKNSIRKVRARQRHDSPLLACHRYPQALTRTYASRYLSCIFWLPMTSILLSHLYLLSRLSMHTLHTLSHSTQDVHIARLPKSKGLCCRLCRPTQRAPQQQPGLNKQSRQGSRSAKKAKQEIAILDGQRPAM